MTRSTNPISALALGALFLLTVAVVWLVLWVYGLAVGHRKGS